jgi:hypothetical protein
MARIARKQTSRLTSQQRQSWLRGYWAVSVDRNPEIAKHKETFFEEAMQ